MQRDQPKPLPSTMRVLNFILCAVSSDSRERESLIAQSSPTLCDPVDCNPPGSSIHEILQARILEYGLPFYSPGALPQGLFPTQGSNPDLPCCRQIPYCLNHQGTQLNALQILPRSLGCLRLSALSLQLQGNGFLFLALPGPSSVPKPEAANFSSH